MLRASNLTFLLVAFSLAGCSADPNAQPTNPPADQQPSLAARPPILPTEAPPTSKGLDAPTTTVTSQVPNFDTAPTPQPGDDSPVTNLAPLPDSTVTSAATGTGPDGVSHNLDNDFTPEVEPIPNYAPLNGPAIAKALPAPAVQKLLNDPRIPALQQKIAQYQLFAAYRQLIDLYKNAGLYDQAAKWSRDQARVYRNKGLSDAAIINDNFASALDSEARLFIETTTTAKGAGKLFTGVALEPVTGCYLGAFIDRDDSLGESFNDENFQWHRTPAQFASKTGRTPGSLFMYLKYGQPFPFKWVERLLESGCIPHIAWEPTSLAQVKDDKYLNDFAKDIRKFDFPVFIRFASEMNGKWTPYNGNPTLYKQKFRLVNAVLHRHAPRVATIWCVNNPPLGNAFDYYPGDDGCDWVGVNLYSVPFHENRRDRPAFDESPLSLLAPIYARFSAKKPIAICEFAASHQAVVDRKQIPQFAASKLRLLYGALPLLYPRVKMVDWFNMNTIAHPQPGKTLNDYSLTSHPEVLRAWQDATNSRHFLERYLRLADRLPPVYKAVSGQKIDGQNLITRLGIWSKCFGGGNVYVAMDGRLLGKGKAGGALYLDLDTSKIKVGKHTLEVYLYDARNRFQRKTTASFNR